MRRKIVSIKKIMPSEAIDSVSDRKLKYGKKNLQLLTRCNTEWTNLNGMRKDRDRAKRYTYGDQWSDVIRFNGEYMTEKSYISKKGNVPLVNNLIRRLVNNVVGVYVKGQGEPVCTARDVSEQKIGEMMSVTLQSNWQTNKMNEILSVLFEDFLITGAAFGRETFEFRRDQNDTWTDICNPYYMFFNSSMKDPRHWDLNLIGEIHDISFGELCSKFANSRDDYSFLKDIYKSQSFPENRPIVQDKNDSNKLGTLSFYSPNDPMLCRVFEVWTKETKERYLCHDPLESNLYKIELSQIDEIDKENDIRIKEGVELGIPVSDIPIINARYFVDSYWYFQYLSPNGTVLLEGETPFSHKEHPYSLRLYPFINGEVHSYVSDIIDQQRYINRLITLDDFVKRSGAKGVTMIPTDCLGDRSPEEFLEEWTAYDGVIFYDPDRTSGEVPKQFYSNSVNLGTAELVQMQLKFMEDAASVHGAMQGRQPLSGTSANLYAQQMQNSVNGLTNLMNRFNGFVKDLAIKKAKNIQQFYTDPRIVSISGKNYTGVRKYDPKLASDLEYDLSVTETSSTPVNRMLANDMLVMFWEKGAITLETLLKHGDFFFSESLLQELDSMKEMQQQGQIPGVDPNMMNMIQQQADQGSIDQANRMLIS